MQTFDNEIASLRPIASVIAAATALVLSIGDRVEAAIEAFKRDNPDADTSDLDATIAGLRTQADELAAAVAANTSQASSDGAGIVPGSGDQQSTGGQPTEGEQSGGAEPQSA